MYLPGFVWVLFGVSQPLKPSSSPKKRVLLSRCFSRSWEAILNLLVDGSVIKKNFKHLIAAILLEAFVSFFAHGKTTQIGDFLHIT